MRKSNIVEDHLGNSFNSFREMCEYWGVNYNTYLSRVNMYKYTKEEALTKKVKKYSDNIGIDHLGNKFKSTKDMCEHWGIPLKVFKRKINSHWRLEIALTKKVKNSNRIVDHIGNEFDNIKEMCNYWGICETLYCSRSRYGNMSLKSILTKPNCPQSILNKIKDYIIIKEDRNIFKDHLRNEFISLDRMRQYYKIDYTSFCNRILEGWSLCDTLTIPLDVNAIKDHLGNTYKTKKEMCRKWGIKYSTLITRKRLGWDLKKILTTPENSIQNKQ